MYTQQQATEWDKDPQKVNRARIFASEINAFIRPDKKLNAMEFGCGTGLLSFELKDYFRHITLVDTSEHMINVLSDKIKTHGLSHFTPQLADLLNSDTIIADVDVIYMSMVLHHVQQVDQALGVFARTLPPQGYLCVADLVSEDGSFHAGQPDFDGHNGFEKQEIERKFEDNGFRVVFYNEVFAMEKQFGDKTRSYPLFLMIGQKK